MNDDSMQPNYRRGSLIVADRDTNGNISGSDCVVQVKGVIMIKRVYKTDFGYLLYSYKDVKQAMAKEIDILAVVLGGITEEKLKEYYKLD